MVGKNNLQVWGYLWAKCELTNRSCRIVNRGFFESGLGHKHFGDWRHLCKPAIGTTQALGGQVKQGGFYIE